MSAQRNLIRNQVNTCIFKTEDTMGALTAASEAVNPPRKPTSRREAKWQGALKSKTVLVRDDPRLDYEPIHDVQISQYHREVTSPLINLPVVQDL